MTAKKGRATQTSGQNVYRSSHIHWMFGIVGIKVLAQFSETYILKDSPL